MNILSYRGPGSAGGVSGALSRILLKGGEKNSRWCYMGESGLFSRTCHRSEFAYICSIPKAIIEGHYRYCNNFLWPIFHDMPEYATYSAKDRSAYRHFNLAFTYNTFKSGNQKFSNYYFVQDYQLSLVPALLVGKASVETNVFWHIPWPRNVESAYVEAIAEVAEGLLSSQKLGFHTIEYASNFLHFVYNHLPLFDVDFKRGRVVKRTIQSRSETEVVVHPIGLDLEFWEKNLLQAATAGTINPRIDQLMQMPYILSVDRADYTKGVLQRIQSIDHFFSQNPDAVGEISFVQVCQRTRSGLPAFDKYWQQCQQMAQVVNDKWSRGEWRPLIWSEEPASSLELSLLYKNAVAMLVNPLRDGLNLTAKEFVACGDEEGILLLSQGAGVWSELGEQAWQVEPQAAERMATQINQGLSLSKDEKKFRLTKMKSTLPGNTLAMWWQKFAGNISTNSETNALAIRAELLRDKLRVASR